jgi:hypothetical protein
MRSILIAIGSSASMAKAHLVGEGTTYSCDCPTSIDTDVRISRGTTDDNNSNSETEGSKY